jgi:DNA polymerase-4
MGRSADIPRERSSGDDRDDSGCPILHVDMDAFFASVEIRRRPELRNRPVVVGGVTRGVVAAASYAARRYGIRSAMSMSHALRLCPHAVVLPPDRQAYAEASEAVMAILRDVTPIVEPLSLDEAFLDVSRAQRLLGRPGEIAAAIRARVAQEQQLTCSVGVASTKFVAKLASARCKPDGMLVVPAEQTLEFLHPLPVTVLWGVGKQTAAPLHRLGIRTVADLAVTPIDTLRRAVGKAAADHLSDLSHGIDRRSVQTRDVEKSISSDRTLDVDLTSADAVIDELFRQTVDVAKRLRSRELTARTIGIKIRFADFTTVTRVRTLAGWTDSSATIHQAAVELYRSLDLDQPRIRLVGVKAENLRLGAEGGDQLVLDVSAAPGLTKRRSVTGQVAAEHAADVIRAKFGSSAVGFATMLPPGPKAEVEGSSGPLAPSDANLSHS